MENEGTGLAMENAGEIVPRYTGPDTESEPHGRYEAFLFIGLIIALGVIGSIYGAMIGLKFLNIQKQDLHLSVSTLGTMGIIIGIPGYLQPFLGTLSDLHPLLGYRRRSYWVVGHILITLSLFSLLPFHHFSYAQWIGIRLFFALGALFTGVAFNAVMVRVGNRTGMFGTFQSISQLIPILMSILFTAWLSGYVASHWSNHTCFLIAGMINLLIIPFVFLMPDRRVNRSREGDVNHAEQKKKQQLEQENTKRALKAAASTPGLWAVAAFVFYLIFTPGINNAIFYFQRDQLHLSLQFIGDLGAWGAAGGLLALGIFTLASRFLPVYALVWGAYLMDCIGYIFLMFMKGAVSAEWTTLGYSAVGVLYGLCLYTLAARATPKGIEGTVYGLILAVIALAGTLSEKFGSWLYDYFGPANKEHHYTLLHGWNSSLETGLIFTLCAAIFIPFLPAWTRGRELLKDTATMENM